MCSDHDINQTFFQILYCFFLLRLRPKTAHQVNTHRKIFKPLNKCIIVLLRKNRCRYKINNLFPFLHCLKSCSYRNFSLTIPYISADQPIHDLRALHILLCRLDCLQLILRLFKWKHLLKLSLPDRIRSINITFCLLARCVEFYKIFCD